MGTLTQLFQKSRNKNKKTEAGKTINERTKAKHESTGTLLRRPDKATPITREKAGLEFTTLEIAEQQEWEVKTLPVWQPGDVILDTYEVEDVISGGMGHVYIANHKGWNVKLAIKSPNEMMLKNKSNFARILREASSWTELGLHPNIAYCYYVRNIEDVPHIFVEYVDGGNLRQWIEEGKCIDYRTNLDLAIQFCHGMEHAHFKGMIHRDIKPENILMTQDGVLKITDFGLVRGGDSLQAEDPSIQKGSNEEDSSLTVVGAEMGTWGYMSPEQKDNPHEVDERADIFAFGICLYEMFCGNRPYEITFGPRQEPPDPVSLSGDESFPKEIGAVLTKAVQWNPTERYKDFTEIRQAFCRIYRNLFGEDSLYAELELVDLEADGLNNQGVAYFELGRKENAINCWEKALKINRLHLEATYNHSLIQWRTTKIADDEVLRRLDNCSSNPSVDKERLSELITYIHAERYAPDAAMDQLKMFPGRYEDVFASNKISQIICVRTMKGHTSTIYSACFTPDGRYAVSGSDDKSLRMWDLKTGQCVRTMKGHTKSVKSVAISSDGRYAVSAGSWDKTLRMWDLDTGQCVRIIEGHTDTVESVSISPDGRFAVSASDDKTLRMWDLETGQCVRTMEGHTKSVKSVAISSDGRYAVSASRDKTLRLWELETGKCVRTMEGHTIGVYSVSISSDDRYAVSGSWDETLRIWELETGQCVRTMKGHTSGIDSACFTPDGRYAVSGSDDKTLRLWDFETGQCVRTMEGHTGGVESVSISSDGRYAVSGSRDKTLRMWELETEMSYQAELMMSFPKGFDQRTEEEKIIKETIHEAKDLYRKGDHRLSYAILYKAWSDIGFSYKDIVNKLYFKLMKKGRINNLAFSFQEKLLEGHTGWVYSVSISLDGRYAVSGSDDKTIRIWELETGRCLRTMEGHTSYVMSVSISSDGRYAVSGSHDDTLRMWELATGQCVRTLEGHTDPVRSVCISPDGRYAVSGGHDETLRIWELETGRCVRTMKGHTKLIWSVSISSDGRYAVSGSSDKTLRIWELETGQCVRTMEGHTSYVRSVPTSSDGRYAVSGSHDKTIRIWELESGRCVRTMEGHTDGLWSVSLSPDGRHLVTGSGDRTLRIWELIWDLEFPDPADWDEGVRPYLEIFLTLRKGKWTEEDFQELIKELAEKRGYGWVRPGGIRKELERMTKDYRS